MGFFRIQRGVSLKSLALSRITFLQNRIYWANHVVNSIGSFLFGYITSSIWKALLKDPTEASQMVTYVLVNQAILWVTTFLPKGAFIPSKIRSGNIVFDLIRPSGLLFLSFWQVAGAAFYNFLYRSVPIFLFSYLLIGLEFPALSCVFPFFVSVLLAFIIAFFINYGIGLWAMAFLDDTAGRNLYFFLTSFFSGYYLPAEYYPGVLKAIVPLTPFACTNYIPVQIYLGKISLLRGFSLQLFWVAALFGLCTLLTRYLLKKTVIQGG
jgi:ABC-2 type transport system permease protein